MPDDKPMILTPGIDAAGVWAIQNSPRAKIAGKFYRTATGIKNRAGAFVGFALNDSQLEDVLRFQEVKGRELAKHFFNQYAQASGSSEVGKFILVGLEVDTFLDLLAGLPAGPGFKKSTEIVTPHSFMPAKEINTKEEGKRW